MNTKIPPPIVTATFGLIIYFSKSFSPVYSFENSNMISVIFLLFGLGIFSAAVQSFKKHKTTINPLSPDKASSLVNSGIFSYSRNPMYLGMLLILLAVSFKFNISGGLFISFLFKIYITRFQIIPEEKAMAKLFGEEFITYKNQTRRWI
ncbi:MAG: isoprenylcysteine carboxylmethyltransferase family protein [Candidatus Marinimicrobia bacterium]|nr:isoprenylcysteine carboxylmethyltransferase family protein [Candidatus Neomarinimicrobiota bacterium]